MTAASPRTFPVSRAYQTWLRDLAPVQPRRLWFCHLLVHRVEALVSVTQSYRLDPFLFALLRGLFTAGNQVTSLDRLALDGQLAGPLVRELVAAGLVHAEKDDWTLTNSGHAALASGSYSRHSDERRVFFFVDNAEAAPQYIPLRQTAGPLADAGNSWRFAPTILSDCFQRDAKWKKRVGFPPEVESFAAETPASWRQVLFDRAEHSPLLLVETAVAEGGSALVGYLVRCDNWTLQRESPSLVLGEGWQELLPDFAEGLLPQNWHTAWQAWCQSRQLSSADAAACVVEYASCKLHVKAPKAFIERLKGQRNEVLRGDTWLTVGAGRTRAAACVEIREQE
jgi:hypothetical protein